MKDIKKFSFVVLVEVAVISMTISYLLDVCRGFVIDASVIPALFLGASIYLIKYLVGIAIVLIIVKSFLWNSNNTIEVLLLIGTTVLFYHYFNSVEEVLDHRSLFMISVGNALALSILWMVFMVVYGFIRKLRKRA